VEDVARAGFREVRNERTDVGDGRFERDCHWHHGRLNGLCAATARDACGRARGILAPRLFVAGTGLTGDQRREPRSTERQYADDDGEHEPPHHASLALGRTRRVSEGRSRRRHCGFWARSRLLVVRRLVGLLLAHSLVVSSAMASSMHVHEYAEHDHPDHHHGPASHEHKVSVPAERDHQSPTDHDHPAFEAESCDAGRHAVAVSLGGAQVPQAHVDLGELPGPTIVAPAASIRSAIPVVDVRVHGPPFDARIPARAPPQTPNA
jgi:hypothetical protein